MTIKDLIAECTAYDYKMMLEESRPKSWLKSVSAFANTVGGSLFFGIDNDGTVKGLDDIQHVTEAVSMKIRDYMDPLPDVEMIPLEQEGKHVLQLKVKEGVYTPYYFVWDGQRVAFVRNGDESIPATGEQMVRLVLKGTNRTYDSLRTDKRVEDHSFAILANTFRDRVQQEWDKKYLLSFGLVTDDGYLTNAGALFADDCWLSQSRLYCTRWDGLEKNDAIDDAEFKGNILLLLREAMAFVKATTRKGWEKLPNGRKNKPEYAERAVLEAMVNHFIHRDYTVMGGEVHLDIYDDRIAVTSPGGMYSGQIVQDIPLEEVSSSRRNPVLADVMAQLDYMEKRGSGLKRICNETKALESYKEDRKPVFKSTVSQFVTTIYSMEYEKDQVGTNSGLSKDTSKVQAVTKLLPSSYQVVAKLSLSVPMIYELLEKIAEPMSAKDMRQFCGQAGATYFKSNVIDPLIAEGVAAMTQPDSPKSPTQKYYLTDFGKLLLEEIRGAKQAAGVSGERVNRLIAEFAEALPHFGVRLPMMEERYKKTLLKEEVHIFPVQYLMKKDMFGDSGTWTYNTPELYLREMEVSIWQHYNLQFLMHRADASYQIRFSEIKKAFNALDLDGSNAVVTSFRLNTFDDLYGGETRFTKTEFGYMYGDMPVYLVPAHDDRMIVMRKELLPRCEPKEYEGPDKAYRLINEEHLLYSNLLNMKEEKTGLVLEMMRDLKFYCPKDEDFHYVKLVVDRMERAESELERIRKMD